MNDIYLEKRIYYHDTDAGGVVYYARYLEHLEEARTEYCRRVGIDIAALAADGLIFPVVHLEVDYKSPARYGEVIRIYTRPENLGNASIKFSQEIKHEDRIILQAKTVWACVDRALKVQRVPADMRAKLIPNVSKQG